MYNSEGHGQFWVGTYKRFLAFVVNVNVERWFGWLLPDEILEFLQYFDILIHIRSDQQHRVKRLLILAAVIRIAFDERHCKPPFRIPLDGEDGVMIKCEHDKHVITFCQSNFLSGRKNRFTSVREISQNNDNCKYKRWKMACNWKNNDISNNNWKSLFQVDGTFNMFQIFISLKSVKQAIVLTHSLL